MSSVGRLLGASYPYLTTANRLHTFMFNSVIMSSINLETPTKCTADFCLIPIGTPTASVSAQIAEVQRLLKKSGLKYSMHSAGTTLGEWVILCVYRPVVALHQTAFNPSTSEDD